MNSPRHIPVMLNEVLDTLKPEAGKIYVAFLYTNAKNSIYEIITVQIYIISRGKGMENVF